MIKKTIVIIEAITDNTAPAILKINPKRALSLLTRRFEMTDITIPAAAINTPGHPQHNVQLAIPQTRPAVPKFSLSTSNFLISHICQCSHDRRAMQQQ